MKTNQLWPALIALLFTAGCGMEGPAPSDNKPAPVAPQTADNAGAARSSSESRRADAQPAAIPGRAASSAGQAPAVADTKSSSAASPESKPGTVREAAHVGMGEKGRGYGNGLIAVTVASLWATKERMALIQMREALNLYKGEHGYFPKTQDEFMEKIIRENHIGLPKLPEGQSYEYDPQEGELMVRMPADPNGP